MGCRNRTLNDPDAANLQVYPDADEPVILDQSENL
jgi:hypothetical protein